MSESVCQSGRMKQISDENEFTLSHKHSHTWSNEGYYSFCVTAFVIQRYLKSVSEDWMELQAEGLLQHTYEFGKSAQVTINGTIIFSCQGKIFTYSASSKRLSQTLSANSSINELVESLKKEIRENNPLRREHLHIIQTDFGLAAVHKKQPTVSFDDLIIPAGIKDDIFDNTIFHLKHLRTNNGIIFHGAPGTGKSLACKAVIRSAIAAGFSTCFIVGAVEFALLAEFIETFLGPTVLVVEDIDTFGCDRETSPRRLADFLQFLSGLSELKEPLIVIATTNYVDRLDAALGNRPVRFNRKYEFKRPTNEEIDALIGLHFSNPSIEPEQKALCYDKEFTGAHISEVKRMAVILSKKHAKPEHETFSQAVESVHAHFSPTLKSIGF